ncbi:hypothetical protein SAMN02745127_02184 [Oceanospirillum multiglobuliferum]|uniref:DUF2007 domain-containing protein n=1 Tax=Oceanospirillum multiglobuliferum TaxID=64969 RepID=A0A1T4R5I2_9GAMM|nr:DUF6164 family protein [Oceanospirillum multiglobuliferum]OPX55225.1 hypothetical protein BTE48_09815 [Oceanospirillum multiglobuliferum]SKA11213.1 hypothetical protein SAMN02745127_02184 [Oceanospirillum multiglobuliferum]
MAKLLFKLNAVTEEEANFVRTRLDEAEVNYYETSQGRFGISLAAIWLRDEEDYETARALLDSIQQEWLEEVQQHPIPTTGQRFIENPLRFILTLIAIIAIASLTLIPFMDAFE